MTEIVFSPLIPTLWLFIISSISIVLSLYFVARKPFPGCFRALALMGLVCLIAQPKILSKETTPLPDIALIIADKSESQKLDQRDEITSQAVEQLRARLQSFSNLETISTVAQGREETRLVEDLSASLSTIPRGQLAGVFVISDGQTTNTPITPEMIGLDAPLHLLLTGRLDEKDRVLEIISAPRYGVINESVEIKFKVSDFGLDSRLANVSLKLNGRQVTNQSIKIGEEVPLSARLDTPGKTIIEITASPAEGELSTRNNRAVVEISVIRDRLRVLLVSGEPHAGERVWRNLLKSDPAVDLIHFTILKPAAKALVGSQDELALIVFPQNELFLEKLDQFDVLIFDRYTWRDVMQSVHFDNISRYVQQGGAMLISSGPEFTGSGSVARRRNLSFILPALPTGAVTEIPFRVQRNEKGQRHPITADLQNEETWGRWLRSIDVQQRSGDTLLERPDGSPILIVDRVGNGRVGLLLSDHVWLWARKFDGGGPHRELLRRLVHWLMKEPELEEEAITMETDTQSDEIKILRQTLEDNVAPVELTLPDGTNQTISLQRNNANMWEGRFATTTPGLYTATSRTIDGRTLFDVTAAGIASPPEFQNLIATDKHLRPLIDASGGRSFTIRDRDTITLPALRRVRDIEQARANGTNTAWAGLVKRHAERVDSTKLQDIFPLWVWGIIITLSIIVAWLIEAGRRPQFWQKH